MLRSTSGVAEYCIQYAERASIEHRTRVVPRNHEGLSAQVAQPGLSEKVRGDGGSSCLLGRECSPRLWTTLWVKEKVSEKAFRLRKHPTQTNAADLATEYLTRPGMEMLLAASNLVLSGEGEKMLRTS